MQSAAVQARSRASVDEVAFTEEARRPRSPRLSAFLGCALGAESAQRGGGTLRDALGEGCPSPHLVGVVLTRPLTGQGCMSPAFGGSFQGAHAAALGEPGEQHCSLRTL